MNIISWNVNGLRAIQNKGFKEFINVQNPDILCLQETKVNTDDHIDLQGFYHHYNHAKKLGYSGTVIFTKTKPLKVTYGIDHQDHDCEGRVITAEYDQFYVVTVYVPNAQRELTRLDYRQVWDKAFLSYLQILDKTKPVIVCGDFNVAHKEIDLARPKQNVGSAGFTVEERLGMDNYEKSGFVDVWRHLHPNNIQYTWWSYMFHARSKNIGWRIDYFLVSRRLLPQITKAEILTGILGSDHCPVTITLSPGIQSQR